MHGDEDVDHANKHASRITSLLAASLLLQCLACAAPAEQATSASPPVEARKMFTLSGERQAARFSTTELLGVHESASYVQFTVVDIENPEVRAIYFDVHLYTNEDDARLLGSFATFPADNPGTFLVRAEPAIHAGATLSVTLRLPEAERPQTEAVRVVLLEPKLL